MNNEELLEEFEHIHQMIKNIYGNNYSRYDLLATLAKIDRSISLMSKKIKESNKLETLEITDNVKE